MSKRKLSKQQAWRIKKIQSERALRALRKEQQIERQLQAGSAAGEAFGNENADFEHLGEEQPGRVIAHYGTTLLVEPDNRGETTEPISCHFRSHLGHLAAGDRVIIRLQLFNSEPSKSEPFKSESSKSEHSKSEHSESEHSKSESSTFDRVQGVIVARLERHSEILRPTQHGGLKPVAANVDLMLIVIAPVPTASTELIDRYLVGASVSRIRPILLLNKVDVIAQDQESSLNELLSLYQSLGITTLRLSAKDITSLDPLLAVLQNQTSVFVGQSGVGKSSLVNALLPDESLQIGALSATHNLGRHTTTMARLYRLPSGGSLIDSPGIRDFGLWHLSKDSVLAAFEDIDAVARQCQFRNCQHQKEPGCRVQQALTTGELHASRFASYQRILKQMDKT